MWPDTHRCTPPSRTSAFRSVRRDCFPRGLAFSQVPRPISPRGGSIPASAGQPQSRLSSGCNGEVYPREYGAAISPCAANSSTHGLSPRVRGSPHGAPAGWIHLGSIPASTGQPLVVSFTLSPCAVYPREYGAAATAGRTTTARTGLSPRVRGSLGKSLSRTVYNGSIPASTGQPESGARVVAVRRVYPREYGAAGHRRGDPPQNRGLSPRVRGSPRRVDCDAGSYGSIPASTGQPPHRVPADKHHRVYPREYGAATYSDPSKVGVWGLSPRVRGSLVEGEPA